MRHPKADAGAQRVFLEKIERYEQEGRAIVYIDESGFAHDMPRRHGYAPKGQRCVGTHDWHARGRINVIGALLAGVMLSVGLLASQCQCGYLQSVAPGGLDPKAAARRCAGDGSRHL